jgi:hypothetical protein
MSCSPACVRLSCCKSMAALRHATSTLWGCLQVAEDREEMEVSEERVVAVRRQLKEEMMAKIAHDRSAGALAAAKQEAEAKARCVVMWCFVMWYVVL